MFCIFALDLNFWICQLLRYVKFDVDDPISLGVLRLFPINLLVSLSFSICVSDPRMLGRSVLSRIWIPTTLFQFHKFTYNLWRCLHLDSYCQTDVSAQVYAYNRAMNDHIKSGRLSSAFQLFDEMPIRDSVSWNLLISGYKRHGRPKQALELYSRMVSQEVEESPSTSSSVMSICSNSGFYMEGLQVHCRVISLGFSSNVYVGSSVVDLYMQMGLVYVGLSALDEMPERNCAVWNLVLRGFCKMSLCSEVLEIYQRMKLDGVEPNDLTFCYLMKGCCSREFECEGKQLHSHFVKVGLVESNLFVANACVDFYSVCGSLIDTKNSFEVISEEDLISWNSIVYSHTNSGDLYGALDYFARMQLWGMEPSIRSFVGLLNLCSVSKTILLGRRIHSLVLKLGFDIASAHVQSALIDMYGKCLDIRSSVDIFDGLLDRSVESCNALMSSLLYCNFIEDVVELFGLMTGEGIGFDEVSLSCTLKALSVPGPMLLAYCSLLHCCSLKTGHLSDNAVSCALIDSYSKSGHVELAREVFDNLPSPNIFCFSSIINGYAWNGTGTHCLKLFELMIKKGLKPDRVTLLCVLTGCNHSGLLEEARMIFSSMRQLYGIDPDRQHYSCMVDLLGRAGLLNEAEELLDRSLMRDDTVMWSSLLRSCRVHQNEAVGQRAAKRLLELASGNPAICLQASSFYYEIGDFESSIHCKRLVITGKVSREIGYSSIESKQADIL